MLLGSVMVPHPPVILPEVGRGEEKKIEETTQGYRKAARFIADLHPDTVVVSTPHSVMYADYIHISPGEGARGDMGQFGAPQVTIEKAYDTQAVQLFARMARERNISAGTLGERNRDLDHATIIPLYFLDKAYEERGQKPDYKLIRIGLSGLPLTAHYEAGLCLRQALDDLGRRAVWIASGDLSHKLREDGPYGFAKEGPQYDERIMDVMGSARFGELFDFSEGFCDSAAECGHRSFVMMAGALDRTGVRAQRVSHQGILGVGYGVCLFEVTGEDATRDFLDQFQARRRKELEEKRHAQDPYTRLARQSVEHFIRTGTVLSVPRDLPGELTERRAGAFVSLHENGQLRGCIGTISPVRASLADEIIHNAVSACSEDPRFDKVREAELDELEYSVDVLGKPEKIADKSELDVRRYGVIVSDGYRRGLLLPDLDGVDTVEEQIDIARRKAGIPKGEKIFLERFEVVRHV